MSEAGSDWVQHAQAIEIAQPAPHGGNGTTLAAPFFASEPGLDFVMRRRTLPRGGSIGAHLHDKDEAYYVVSGAGEYTLDGERHAVRAGSAMLVRNGSTHALRQTESAPLVIIVVYRQLAAPDPRQPQP